MTSLRPLMVALFLCQLSAPALACTADAAPARAMTDSKPMARIRGVDRAGLDPMAFAIWATSRPHLWAYNAEVGRPRKTARGSVLLNLTSELFRKADRNGDRRISATELADLSTSDVDGIEQFRYFAIGPAYRGGSSC